MTLAWHPTTAMNQARHDDIWFITPQIGWAVNSRGQIIHTEDGGRNWSVQQTVPRAWLRCMTFAGNSLGWVGSITEGVRLWRTEDGAHWSQIAESILPPDPSAICGIYAASAKVVYAAGTQYPDRDAGILKTTDGGQSWRAMSLKRQADLLIDVYFTDELHGWVVGGHGGDVYERLKPVVLRTEDGGNTWTDRLADSRIDFPRGEWGWKIQFLNSRVGFISLENFQGAAILKTVDGGQSWSRIEVRDPQANVDLEGIGFIDEHVGWVGGWGEKIAGGHKGTSSATTDGGATWRDANDIGRFINRFRFTGTKPVVGYASGATIYQLVDTDTPGPLLASAADFHRKLEKEIPLVSDRIEVEVDVPAGAKELVVTIFNQRGTRMAVLADESNPPPGKRKYTWHFAMPGGGDAGIGYFISRIAIGDDVTSNMVRRASRASPEELGRKVAELIGNFAPLAQRSHDRLFLPDAQGDAVELKALFDTPLDLMAALIRGGWIVPGFPKRSMFLVSLIGTGPNRGPMQSEFAEADIELLTEWIAGGAVVPSA
jgi:photosystem II stability/assembly factor-like uncharacterized protein